MSTSGTNVEESFGTGGKKIKKGFGFTGHHYRLPDGETRSDVHEWDLKLLFPATENHPIFLCRFHVGHTGDGSLSALNSEQMCRKSQVNR